MISKMKSERSALLLYSELSSTQHKCNSCEKMVDRGRFEGVFGFRAIDGGFVDKITREVAIRVLPLVPRGALS
jgi:hypothetical protein